MTFVEKIDKILTVRGIKLWKLASESGLNSTLEKAYADDREMTGEPTRRFLQKLRINSAWWESGEGDIFLPAVNETANQDQPDLYHVIVDTMKHILDQNTTLINQRQGDIDKLHKDKEWMSSHIDDLTSKIPPAEE